MAKCKQCGKHGIFLRVNKDGFCDTCAKNTYKQNSAHVNRLAKSTHKMLEEDRLASEQIKRLNDAREKYEEPGQYDKLIAVYEDVFSSPVHFNAASHKLALVQFYQKSGQNDKAWSLLNIIAMEYPDDLCRVRRIQYHQLKGEKNYSEALKMYFLYRFNDCKSITCWPDVKEREQASFQKEVHALVKKAGLDVQSIPELISIFVSLIENPRASEAAAVSKFKSWYRKANNE